MANTDREFRALTAYLKLLTNKGAEEVHLEQRKQFLLKLIPLLAEQAQSMETFKKHVETALLGVEKTQWPFLQIVSKEYFPFWVDDIKTIAALHASGGYELAPAVAQVPTEDLKTLWENLDKAQFSVSEKWPLKAYTTALKAEGAKPGVIETRVRLVKLLLLQLRRVEDHGGDHYRLAVHGLLPLFELRETRQMFLAVVREFYYFWVGDPDATRFIVLKSPSL